MKWSELGPALGLANLAGWPDPALLQGFSPSQDAALRRVLAALVKEARSSLGQVESGLRWPGEGWIWREEEGGEWTPADPSAEVRALRARARALVWEQSEDSSDSNPTELFPLLAELLREPLRARAAAHEDRLEVLQAPGQVRSERWLCASRELPAALLERVGGVPAQVERWAEEDHPEPVVDTGLLDPDLAHEVATALGDTRSGVVAVGDNASALRAFAAEWGESIQCAYLDPPYNTGSRSFAYRDHRPRAAWLSFIDERLALVRALLREDGTLYAQIDQHEQARLRLLLDRHLEFVSEIVWRIGWVSGFKTRAKRFIRNHDTIFQYGRVPKPLFFKHYLPYPEGYLRRDGKPPTGKGIPLEDTWNCNPQDRLDSVQIVSFSREKVGKGNLTQKSEALLARMLEASSRPGDWVLDPFLGSGTTAAVALKLGRRFLGVERDPELVETVIAPRIRRVLGGDRYGISKATNWSGGGVVQIVHLGTQGRPKPRNGWGGPRPDRSSCVRP